MKVKALEKPKGWPGPKYPCTQCGGDAMLGYTASKGSDWGGKVKVGERLCVACFTRRGGERFF